MKAFYKLFGLLLLASSLLSHAQEAEPIQLKFSVLSWDQAIRGLSYQQGDGESVPMMIPNGSPSRQYEYSGTAPIHFYQKSATTSNDPSIETPPTLSYTPTSLEEMLLIFIPTPKAAVPYRILSVPFKMSRNESESYRFLNFSKFPVYLKFGDDRFQLDSGKDKDIRVNRSSGGVPIAMAVRISEEPQDAKLAYSATWTLHKGRSTLIFITTEPDAEDEILVKKIYY